VIFITISKKKKEVLIIGHKGASKIAPPGNTLKSFQKAIELRADYVEFDIHKSKDGNIVIMHDSNTLNITGMNGTIKDMTLEELKRLDCGEGQKIPTLQELINIAKGKIGLQVEIKARGMEKQIISILKKEDLIESSIISCFNHNRLLKIQKIEPTIKLAALEPLIVGREIKWEDRKRIIKNAVNKNFYAIHPEYHLVNQQLIDQAHENNLKVNAWTVNDIDIMKDFINMGIDGIITDDIEAVKTILNR